jgi:hypothetical protein
VCRVLPFRDCCLTLAQLPFRSPKCRYCGEPVSSGSGAVICAGQACVDRDKLACKRVLTCGHSCPGAGCDKTTCLPCFHEECWPSQQQFRAVSVACGAGSEHSSGVTQCPDEYCAICYVEPLKAAPVIQLACKHVVHAHCAQAKLRSKWNGSRITFSYLGCPLCAVPMQHPLLKPELEAAVHRRFVAYVTAFCLAVVWSVLCFVFLRPHCKLRYRPWL